MWERLLAAIKMNYSEFFLIISRPALAEEPSNYLTITGPCNLEWPMFSLCRLRQLYI